MSEISKEAEGNQSDSSSLSLDTPLELHADSVIALNEVFSDYCNEQKLDSDGLPVIEEDWELSQFWYDKDTGDRVMKYIAPFVNKRENCNVALVSTPTMYRAYIRNKSMFPFANFTIFEYDTRFDVFHDNFCFYDYRKPTAINEKYHHQFDLMIVDPPFLSEEVTEKVTHTVEFLGRGDYAIVYLTGKLVEPYLKKYYKNIELTDVAINHEHHLENAFGCYCTKNPLI